MTPVPVHLMSMKSQRKRDGPLSLPKLELYYQGSRYRLNAGSKDKIHVFFKSICLYVLTINKSHGYIGLDAYVPSEPDPINTIFLHSKSQIAEELGFNWQQLPLETITNRLIDSLI